MKKFLLIILILVLLLIIYIFSFKENFSSNNFDLNDIGLDNLNNFSPIKCSVKVDTESISETKTDDYKKCFTDSDSDKYIEIDKSNNKCKIYEKVSCSGDTDGLLHTNLNTPTKILFRRKSRELLINSQEITQTTAAGTTSVTSSATQQVKRIDGYIDNLYSNIDNFKGVETYLTNNLFNYLND